MGIYINPVELGSDPFKAWWLVEKVTKGEVQPVSQIVFRERPPGKDGKFGVAFVGNGHFDALAVAFNRQEAQVFADMDDNRPRAYCLMHIDRICEYDPKTGALLKEIMSDENAATA
jgi:hypothetical protein